SCVTVPTAMRRHQATPHRASVPLNRFSGHMRTRLTRFSLAPPLATMTHQVLAPDKYVGDNAFSPFIMANRSGCAAETGLESGHYSFFTRACRGSRILDSRRAGWVGRGTGPALGGVPPLLVGHRGARTARRVAGQVRGLRPRTGRL